MVVVVELVWLVAMANCVILACEIV